MADGNFEGDLIAQAIAWAPWLAPLFGGFILLRKEIVEIIRAPRGDREVNTLIKTCEELLDNSENMVSAQTSTNHALGLLLAVQQRVLEESIRQGGRG